MRPGLMLPLGALALGGCVYFNTFYNAKKYYGEGEKIAVRAPQNAGLPASARTAFERSIEKSSQVLTAHPTSKYADDALLLLGKAHFWLGNYAESAAALRSLLESHPESGLRREAAVWLVRAGAQSGDAATAQRISGELLAEGDLSASDRVALQIERAHLALEAGDPASAVGIYEEIERSDPDLARRERVPLLRAEARLAQGDTTAALADLRPLVAAEDDPDLQRDASVALAGVLASTGEPAQAIETYRGVLAGNVSDSLAAEIHLALAETERSSGDVQAAAEELAQVARIAPSTPVAATALYRRGLIQWHELGSRDEAKKTLLEAFLESPDSPAADSATAAARTIEEIQHYQGILAGSERVLSPLPPSEVKATATYLLAELLYTREGDEAGARKLFADMLTLYPGSAWTPKVLYTLGWLAEHGQGTQAESVAAGDSGAAGAAAAAGHGQAAGFYERLITDYPRTEYARYAREALADAARPLAISPVAGGAGPAGADPAAVSPAGQIPTPTEGGAAESAGELLPLPDQSQVVEIPPAAPGAPAEAASEATPPAEAASETTPSAEAASEATPPGEATFETTAPGEAASNAAAAPESAPGVSAAASDSMPSVTGTAVAGPPAEGASAAPLIRAPALGAAGTDVASGGEGEARLEGRVEPTPEPAPDQPSPLPENVRPPETVEAGREESVDEKLMAYTLALPRAQDPLLGIEDRLLARRRADMDDAAPGRRPAGGAAPPGLAAGPASAAPDSLTPAQIDSIAQSGDRPAGAGNPPVTPTGAAGNGEHAN